MLPKSFPVAEVHERPIPAEFQEIGYGENLPMRVRKALPQVLRHVGLGAYSIEETGGAVEGAWICVMGTDPRLRVFFREESSCRQRPSVWTISPVPETRPINLRRALDWCFSLSQ